MLAIDTNIVVRFLTGDDPHQAAKARALIEDRDVFVSTTVLLESEWVLRGAYGRNKVDVLGALTAFAGLPRVTIENPARAASALAWAADGLDFADALHLAAAEACEAFISFDQRFTKAANRVGGVSVREP